MAAGVTPDAGEAVVRIAALEATRKERPVRVGLATDVGGGTSLSFLQTLNEAYKAWTTGSAASRRGWRRTS